MGMESGKRLVKNIVFWAIWHYMLYTSILVSTVTCEKNDNRSNISFHSNFKIKSTVTDFGISKMTIYINISSS